MRIEPHVCFEGRCAEAIEFYRKALGAEVNMMMKFGDMPGKDECPGAVPPGTEDKIMHANVRIGTTNVLMSDGRCQGPAEFKGIQLAVQVDTVAQAEKLFAALSDGGKVIMPLDKTFWSPGFGMTYDKFGVEWMVNAAG
jgi:PhnB protein